MSKIDLVIWQCSSDSGSAEQVKMITERSYQLEYEQFCQHDARAEYDEWKKQIINRDCDETGVYNDGDT